jgi:hypothetical protein
VATQDNQIDLVTACALDDSVGRLALHHHPLRHYTGCLQARCDPVQIGLGLSLLKLPGKHINGDAGWWGR